MFIIIYLKKLSMNFRHILKEKVDPFLGSTIFLIFQLLFAFQVHILMHLFLQFAQVIHL